MQALVSHRPYYSCSFGNCKSAIWQHPRGQGIADRNSIDSPGCGWHPAESGGKQEPRASKIRISELWRAIEGSRQRYELKISSQTCLAIQDMPFLWDSALPRQCLVGQASNVFFLADLGHRATAQLVEENFKKRPSQNKSMPSGVEDSAADDTAEEVRHTVKATEIIFNRLNDTSLRSVGGRNKWGAFLLSELRPSILVD